MESSGTMADIEIFVLLVVLALVVGLVARRLNFPYTLALVVTGLVLGWLPVLTNLHLDPNVVLFVFLPALLFEGAWNIDIQALKADWLAILLLAVPGLALSLGVVAVVAHFGAGLPWLVALLLGAIVSPTDPIAVLSLLRQLGMPDRLCAIIEGESLFNDGVGAAAFELVYSLLLLSLGLSSSLSGLSTPLITLDALWLLGGGLILGVLLGFIVTYLVRQVTDPLIETTVTFSVAYGAYILATLLGTSGLLAVVGAGLVLGSYGRRIGISRDALRVTDNVWMFVAFLANSLLFILVGVQIGSSHSILDALPAILWGVLGVIAGRALMVYTLLPAHDLLVRWAGKRADTKPTRAFSPLPVPRVWRPLILLSGLRGALSLALVLSLSTATPQRDILTLIVYGVVLVTLVGQGIGLRIVLPHWPRAESVPAPSQAGAIGDVET
ncbi:MAG: Na+/H+ antiporter [Ktedonobacterales bacterium]|jgi:CPA1 family monovalent cation:H+ antiporter|nr:MAG: Na+/H+ antiporter [Ktedonobacterales bacterium]